MKESQMNHQTVMQAEEKPVGRSEKASACVQNLNRTKRLMQISGRRVVSIVAILLFAVVFWSGATRLDGYGA